MSFTSHSRAMLGFAAASCVLSSLPLHAGDMPGDYFPDGKFNSFEVDEWFGKDLVSMEEPSLYRLSKKDPTAEVYRFAYFPSSQPVIALKLEVEPDGSGLLEIKKKEQVYVNSNYEPGRMIKKMTLVVPVKSVQRFRDLLAKIHFWKLPIHTTSLILGGTEWLYEGVDQGRYHVVDRSEPDNPGVEAPGTFLMKLSGEWK